MTHTQIFRVATVDDAVRCFDIMHELRPHLTLESYVARVERQQAAGYRLAFVESGGTVQCVAGYRIIENLAWGRILYVDDLVTAATAQDCGHGSALFDWLLEEARLERCDQFHLDSGVQRHGAHRFYLHKGMAITCHHFAMKL